MQLRVELRDDMDRGRAELCSAGALRLRSGQAFKRVRPYASSLNAVCSLPDQGQKLSSGFFFVAEAA
jgi:hypothetical protein